MFLALVGFLASLIGNIDQAKASHQQRSRGTQSVPDGQMLVMSYIQVLYLRSSVMAHSIDIFTNALELYRNN